MKCILSILLLISAVSYGQIGRGDDSLKYIRYQNQYGQRMPRGWWDSVAHMPYGDTAAFPKPCRPGAIMMHTNKAFYQWNGGGWESLGGSQNLQQVTDRGNKTTDTVISSGIRTPNILSDTINEPDYEIALIPDIQYETESYPLILDQQFKWFHDSASYYNIKAIIQLGDITNNGTVAQFVTANNAFKHIDSTGIPYMAVMGNHDYDSMIAVPANIPNRVVNNYNAYFGPSRYAGKTFYGGNYNNSNENFYIKFNAGITRYLVLGLEFIPRDSSLAWAQRVLDSFPDRKAIIATHNYISFYGEKTTDTSLYATNSYSMTGNAGQAIWDKLIKNNPQIAMVVCGHQIHKILNLPIVQRISEAGDYGNVVNQILTNYQDDVNGGNGYFMRVKVKPSTGQANMSMFSPVLQSTDTRFPPFTLGYPETKIAPVMGIAANYGGLYNAGETRLDGDVYINKLPSNHMLITGTTGRLDTLTAQNPHKFLAGGTGSSDTVPFFRTIVLSDLPSGISPATNNGISKDVDTVKLGQNIGQAGDPAALNQSREIPMNGYDLVFKNIGRGNAGNIKLYKDATKGISFPFLEFKDQRDTTILQINSDSLGNTAIGKRVTQSFTTASNNTMIGSLAGVSVTSGPSNTFIGSSAAPIATTAGRNVAVGASAMFRLTTGFENVAVGASTLTHVSSGNDNISVGYTVANNITTGNFNIAMGGGGSVTSALDKNTTGSRNIALGISAAAEGLVSTSNFNGVVSIGTYSLFKGSTGDKNIAIGDSAAVNSTVGKSNVIIGANAITASTTIGDSNVIASPGMTNSTLSSNNTVVGSNFHSTSSISNISVFGSGMTNNQNNVARIARADQNLLVGYTGDQADNGYRVQVNGAGYFKDSVKIDNLPNGSSTDSTVVVRNNVLYKVANTGGGAVSSVSNSDGSLTISPTTGSVVGSINLAHSNTWTAQQNVTVSGQTGMQINMSNTADGTYGINFNRSANTVENAFNYSTNGTSEWFFGEDNNATSNFYVYDWIANKYVLKFDVSTGDVGFGNSLNAFVVKNDGTGISANSLTGTGYRVLTADGSGNISALSSSGTSGQVLTSNGTSAPSFQTLVLKGSTTWDPTSVGANSSTSTSFTVTGAALGDPVTISKTSGSYSNGEVYFAYVSATNTVTIQLQNTSGGSFDITSATYNVVVLKY